MWYFSRHILGEMIIAGSFSHNHLSPYLSSLGSEDILKPVLLGFLFRTYLFRIPISYNHLAVLCSFIP